MNSDNSLMVLEVNDSASLQKDIEARMSEADYPERNGPGILYVGVYIGSKKPKPFERKRPSLTNVVDESVAKRVDMRNEMVRFHKGSVRVCTRNGSRRLELALECLLNGRNIFKVLNIEGNCSSEWTIDSVLSISISGLEMSYVSSPTSIDNASKRELSFDAIDHWMTIDNSHCSSDSGIDVFLMNGEYCFFAFDEITYVKHTLEYYWNRCMQSKGRNCQLGSVHGRRVCRTHTLSGDKKAPPYPEGNNTCIIDKDGALLTIGSEAYSRMASVVHQGWMMKKTGLSNRVWSKQYFVLYDTSQGHFLAYYRSCQDSFLFTDLILHKNFIDLSQVIYLRPISEKQKNPSTPPFAFDVVTTTKQWTLCAESTKDLKVLHIFL